MRYYVVEMTLMVGAERETPGIYIYDDYNSALSTFHTKMGGMMKNENVQSELLVILDSYGNTLRTEKYTKPEVVNNIDIEPEVVEEPDSVEV